MRRFTLWNKDRTEFISMNSNTIFALYPKNLGADNKIETVESDLGHYVQHQKVNLQPITFTVHFKGNAYASYDLFNAFVRAHKELVLEYAVGDDVKYRDVRLQRLGKEEKTQFNVLECDLNLLPVSRWWIEKVYQVEGTTVNISVGSDGALAKIELLGKSGGGGTFGRFDFTIDGSLIRIGGSGIIATVGTNHRFILDGINKKVWKSHHLYPNQLINGYGNMRKNALIFPLLPRGEGTFETEYNSTSIETTLTIREWV